MKKIKYFGILCIITLVLVTLNISITESRSDLIYYQKLEQDEKNNTKMFDSYWKQTKSTTDDTSLIEIKSQKVKGVIILSSYKDYKIFEDDIERYSYKKRNNTIKYDIYVFSRVQDNSVLRIKTSNYLNYREGKIRICPFKSENEKDNILGNINSEARLKSDMFLSFTIIFSIFCLILLISYIYFLRDINSVIWFAIMFLLPALFSLLLYFEVNNYLLTATVQVIFKNIIFYSLFLIVSFLGFSLFSVKKTYIFWILNLLLVSILLLFVFFPKFLLDFGNFIQGLCLLCLLHTIYKIQKTDKQRKYLSTQFIFALPIYLFTALFAIGSSDLILIDETIYLIIFLIFIYFSGYLVLMKVKSYRYQALLNIENEIIMEKDKLKHEIVTLKAQLNPHFSLNNYNVLLSLIESKSELSLSFLKSMIKIHSYSLFMQKIEKIEMHKELDFINEYFNLYKIRFKDRIRINIDVPENILNIKVPPFSIQILVENAIKHNFATNIQPLYIDIIYKKNMNSVMITNNIQLKRNCSSTGIGLKNLSRRWELFMGSNFKINQLNDKFIVYLPLNNKI